jgi:nucleoside-diphosphate-sugar epimerase
VKAESALVTGATGFIGRWLVKLLALNGTRVRAGIRNTRHARTIDQVDGVEPVDIDILDRQSLGDAMEGIDVVYHFAALVDTRAPKDDLFRVNVEGTRKVWHCAAERGLKAALYCSSTAVYGLLAQAHQPISEKILPRAIEPYGRSKLLGETVASEIADRCGLHTVIIRPVAVFGPGEHSPFGSQLRQAVFSKILLAGGFQNRRFSFVHVEDVAEAAMHLIHAHGSDGQAYNIAVDRPILFEEAFQSYLRALKQSRRPLIRVKLLAYLSKWVHKLPGLSHMLSQYDGHRSAFKIWQPGFDMTYSSRKLLSTSFRFKWDRFEDVLLSCINE